MELSQRDAIMILIERGIEVSIDDQRSIQEIAERAMQTGSAAMSTGEVRLELEPIDQPLPIEKIITE